MLSTTSQDPIQDWTGTSNQLEHHALNRSRNELRHVFEVHRISNHDNKVGRFNLVLNSNERGGQGTQGLPLESTMQIARTDAELDFQSQRTPWTRLASERRTKQLEIAEREARDTIRQVVMGGSTLVTYSAGLDVQHIVCGYESCFLTIKNLPRNAQQSEVEELVAHLGVDRNLFHVVKMQQVNNEVQARVLSDYKVGHAIAAGLIGIESRDGHYLDIIVGDDSTPNVLTVALTLPSSTMVAQYSTEDAALNALNKLNNAMFRRRKLRVEWCSASGEPSVGHSINISGLPLNVTTAEVEEYSGADLVWVLAVLPGHDIARIVERIRGVEEFEVNLPDPNRSNAKIQFQFSTWDDAKRAKNSLEGWRPTLDCPPLYAWLPMPNQYISIIPLPQYHAQKGLWDSMPVEKGDNKSAFVRVINETDKSTIIILGEDKKAMGKLKVRVQDLLAGEPLDWRLWHRSFTNASGQRFLSRISALTKAYVHVDSGSKILRLYADRDMKQTVVDFVKAHIAYLELWKQSIPIPPSTTEFFIRKGLPTLKEELGEDAATLELHPIPRLIIRGREETYKTVDRLIEESLGGIEFDAYDGEKVTCPSCFGEASSPVLLSCGHLYCADCLRHFLSSAVEGKKFPLVCFGNEGRCGAPVAIPIIRRFLLQQQFDQLVEVAAKAYIEKQPVKFNYCVTPGCIQTYRCRTDSWTLTCPSCFATVCSSCHKEPHDGMTCREKKVVDNAEEERLNEEWAQTVGAKRCPSCQIWIQKTGGCNHMSCRCGAHICWKCLAAFSKAGDVYDHSCTVRRRRRLNNIQPAQHLRTVRRRMRANGVGPPHLMPRTIVNHDADVQRWGWQGHRVDLNFAYEAGPGRQPQPEIGRRRLQQLR